MIFRMSCNAAPLSDVMMPSEVIKLGMGFLRPTSNMPAFCNFCFNILNCCVKSPLPAAITLNTLI